MKMFQKKSGARGIILAVCIAASAIALALFFSTQFMKDSVEYNAELADLYGMRNAELAAAMLAQNSTEPLSGGYWFDPGTNALIPDSEGRPSAGGLGTLRHGGAKAAFTKETGRAYVYDEGTDYRGMVIHLTVGDEIIVEWVPVD